MTTILAIDPGASGGIAVACGSMPAQCFPMPKTEGDVLALFKAWTDIANGGDGPYELTACVEEVSGFFGEGQPGSSMFKFGRGFGFVLGVLQSHNWKIQLVKPQKWQKALGLGEKPTKTNAKGKLVKDNTAWKNKLKSEAQRLYPGLSITLSTADALLLLHYATRQRINA